MTYKKKFEYILEDGEFYLYTSKGVCAKVQVIDHWDYIDNNGYCITYGVFVKMKILEIIADSEGMISFNYRYDVPATIDANSTDHFEFLDRVVWGDTYG